MRSKISFFNGTVLKKNITRFCPIWIAYVAIWAVLFPFLMVADAYSAGEVMPSIIEVMPRILAFSTGSVGIVLTFGVGIVSAMAVFSYLYSAKSANMMASLPLKREGLFLTQYLSGLIWIIGTHIVIAVLAVIVQVFIGSISVVSVLQWFAAVSLMAFFAYTFASFCAALTGHIIVLPVVFVIFNFLAVVMEELVKNLIRPIVYGMSTAGNMLADFLSPPVYLMEQGVSIFNASDGMQYDVYSISDIARTSDGLSINYTGWTALIIYAAVALIMLAGAVLLIRKRQMETASDVVAVKCLKPVFKYCMTFGGAIVIGLALYYLLFAGSGLNPLIVMTILMFIGAFVGFFLAKILITKSFKVFNGWKGFIVSIVIIAAAMCLFEFDITGYEKRVPDNSEVESVSVYYWGEETVLEKTENIEMVTALHKSIIANKGIYEAENEECEYSDDGYISLSYETVSIDYLLNNGKEMSRVYSVPVSDELLSQEKTDAAKLEAILNCEEACSYRYSISIPITEDSISYASVSWYGEEGNYDDITLTSKQAAELYYDCILPDLEDGKLGKIDMSINGYYGSGQYDATIVIEVTQKSDTEGYISDSYDYDSIYVVPNPDSQRTNEYLAGIGVKLQQVTLG